MLDEALSGHTTAGTVGQAVADIETDVTAILADTNELQTDWANGGRLDLLLDGAASAGDPWTTSLPGAYGAGTAGYIIGNNIDAAVSDMATAANLATVDSNVDAILVDTGTTLPATLSTIDTVVDSVKVKTDQMVFTKTNELDVNTKSINSATVVGNGNSTPWDGA